MVGIGGVKRAEDIDIDLVPAQVLPAADEVVKALFAFLVDPVSIVQRAWPVHAQSHEIMASAPAARAAVSLSGREMPPSTRAPIARASCTDAWPTPARGAEHQDRFSPGKSRARPRKATQDVS
jgi:hypothetical protein